MSLQAWWPVANFVLGAGFGILLQVISYRLALRREHVREYWIRRLNSYQDFDHQATHLIDLIQSDVAIPDDVYWQSLRELRKAAYDARFYDVEHPERTQTMIGVTRKLVAFHQEGAGPNILSAVERDVAEIYREFRREEGF